MGLKDDTTRALHLVHSASDLHLFSEELKALEKKNSRMQFSFVSNREEFKEAVSALTASYGEGAYYCTSGSPDVVRSTKKLLKVLGIPRRRIFSESFLGY